MENKCGYDHIVSLGYNCEVSWRIEDYVRGKIDSYPLSWAYIKEQSELPRILDNIEKIPTTDMQFEEISGMFYCKELNISLHTNIEHSAYAAFTDKEKNEFMVEAEREVRERFLYLCSKWEKLLKSGDSTLFIIKIQNQNGDLEWIKDTHRFMQEHYTSGNYNILFVVTNQEVCDKLKEKNWDRTFILLIDSFASDAQTLEGGDRIGWIKGIEYFDHMYDRKNIVLSNFVDYQDKEVISKGEFYSLQSWATEVTAARDWLENQCKQKDAMIEEYEKNIQLMKAEQVAEGEEIQDNQEVKESERKVMQDEIDKLKLSLKKAEYKLGKLENNDAIKRIIKKKNLYY